MRAAIYLRVSTDEQTTENQERELRAAAERMDTGSWRSTGMRASGSKARISTPASTTCTRRRPPACSMSSWLGRSIVSAARCKTSVASYPSCTASASICSCTSRGIDTTTPAGKAMFQMMGVFAEFERSMIRERVDAGIARAKAGGKHCGRPFIDTKLEGRIRDALAAPGRPGLHKIAKQFGVGSGTVQRIAAAAGRQIKSTAYRQAQGIYGGGGLAGTSTRIRVMG